MVTVVKGWYHIDSVANTEGGVWVVVDGEAKPQTISMRFIPHALSSKRLIAPGRPSANAGHPHPESNFDELL
jgi:hypothetical protein